MAVCEEDTGYDIGDRTRLSASFDAEGTPADPTDISFQIRHTSDEEYEEHLYGDGVLKRSDLGTYYVDWTWDKSGNWYYRFVGSGSVGAATEVTLKVRKSKTLQL